MGLAKIAWRYDMLLKFKVGVGVVCVHFPIRLGSGSRS